MKNFFSVLFLFITISVSAQGLNTSIHYKFLIDFSPLAMIQGDNTFMIGGEYRIKEKLGVNLEGGYIFSSSYLDENKRANGFVVRPAAKLYLNNRNNFYCQVQAFYKSVSYIIHDSLRKKDGPYNSYLPLGDYSFQKNVWGTNFIVGWVLPLAGNIGFVDLYVGVGTRTKNQSWVNAKDAAFPFHGMFQDRNAHSTLPNLPAGIKFCLKLN